MAEDSGSAVDINEVARNQFGVVTRAQARAAGLTDDAIDARCRRGTWRRELPGVLTTSGHPLDADGRASAALLYAGGRSLLTGWLAARRHGVRHVPEAAFVSVLTEHGTGARSRGYVCVVETRRLEPFFVVVDGLRLVTAERAVADTARLARQLDTVRAMVADAVQREICGIAGLRTELDEGPRRGSALLRLVLDEVGGGARSAPEAALLSALRRCGLPTPQCNVPLFDADGRVVAVPDLCWPERRLVVEVDSREWHFSPRHWEQTMRRHNRLAALGYTVLHVPPSRLRDDMAGVIAEIIAVYRSLAGRSW